VKKETPISTAFLAWSGSRDSNDEKHVIDSVWPSKALHIIWNLTHLPEFLGERLTRKHANDHATVVLLRLLRNFPPIKRRYLRCETLVTTRRSTKRCTRNQQTCMAVKRLITKT